MRRALPALVSVILVALANAPGCGGGCREEDRSLPTAAVPAATLELPADAPAEAAGGTLAALVPGRAPIAADGVFVVRSLKGLLEDTGLRAALAGETGRMLVAAVEAQLGFSPFDLDALRAAGLAPDAPLVMVTIGESLVLLHIAATDPAKALGIVRRWGADNGVPLEEVTLDAEAGGASGVRLEVPGEGETSLLATEGALLFAFRDAGATPSLRDALVDARAQTGAWRERLALFAPHEQANALLVGWSQPTSEAEAADIFGLEPGADNAFVKSFLDGMTGAATFYEEADNFTTLALERNGLRLTVRDRVTGGEAARQTLAAAVDLRSTLALVPDEPIALVMETVRKADVAPWIEMVGELQEGFAEAFAAFGRAWDTAAVDGTMWNQPGRLRLLGFAFWGPDSDSDTELDMTFFVELADDAATTRDAADRLFTALGTAGPLPPPARSAWEDVPVWYLAKSADPDAAVCTTLDRLLVCAGRADRLKRVIARFRQSPPPAAPTHDLAMYWRADPQRLLATFPVAQLGIPRPLLQSIDRLAAAVGPITFVERLDAAGAALHASIEGRDRPVLGALLEVGFELAGLF